MLSEIRKVSEMGFLDDAVAVIMAVRDVAMISGALVYFCTFTESDLEACVYKLGRNIARSFRTSLTRRMLF